LCRGPERHYRPEGVLNYARQLGNVHGVLPCGGLELEDADNLRTRAVKADVGDLATRSRIELNRIHNLAGEARERALDEPGGDLPNP